MRCFWRLVVSLGLAVPVLARHAPAADVQPVVGPGQDQGLRLTGEIDASDVQKFVAAITQIEAEHSGRHTTALALDSRGGLLAAATAIAEQIRVRGMTTVVEDGAVCASACVLLFAAGAGRIASPTAAIGVHGVADRHGVQSGPALAATAVLAQRYAQYGVPLSVIGRMAATKPHDVAWLTATEVAQFPRTVITPMRGDAFVGAASEQAGSAPAAPADAQGDWAVGFRYGVAHPGTGCGLDTRAVRDVLLANQGCEVGEQTVRSAANSASGVGPPVALPHVFHGPHGE